MKDTENRRVSRGVKVGKITLGALAPVLVQSMTNTDTLDEVATIAQIRALEKAGCEIVRVTVPNEEAAQTVKKIHEAGITIPVVADIHFDYRIALACVRAGVDKIRINPGNIGEEWKIKEVALACRNAGIPIRIGVNGGSLEKHILEKYGAPTPEALAESAFYHAELLEKFGFSDIVISVKTSDTRNMIAANRLIASRCDYPLHLGVTEAGDRDAGTVKSAIGIGSLLNDGIGDTIRVSLTADPVEEIYAAKKILSALNMERGGGITVVSCPTCGRTKINLISLCERFKEASAGLDTHGKRIKVALMGCVVNGPGEAREADVGVAGGIGEGLLFRHGEIIEKIPEDEIIPRLLREIEKIAEN